MSRANISKQQAFYLQVITCFKHLIYTLAIMLCSVFPISFLPFYSLIQTF